MVEYKDNDIDTTKMVDVIENVTENVVENVVEDAFEASKIAEVVKELKL